MFVSVSFVFAFIHTLSAQSLSEIESQRVTLSNGWKLTPVGQQLPLGDLPLNMMLSSSKKYLAVTNNGQSNQCVQLFDAVGPEIA